MKTIDEVIKEIDRRIQFNSEFFENNKKLKSIYNLELITLLEFIKEENNLDGLADD